MNECTVMNLFVPEYYHTRMLKEMYGTDDERIVTMMMCKYLFEKRECKPYKGCYDATDVEMNQIIPPKRVLYRKKLLVVRIHNPILDLLKINAERHNVSVNEYMKSAIEYFFDERRIKS